jgi:hypothetical protein
MSLHYRGHDLICVHILHRLLIVSGLNVVLAIRYYYDFPRPRFLRSKKFTLSVEGNDQPV